MVPVSNKRTINTINEALVNGTRDQLSTSMLDILEKIEAAYEISEDPKKQSKGKIAKEIAEQFDISLQQAYTVVNNMIDLYGLMEYPGLDPMKIFQIRRWENIYAQAMDKFMAQDVGEKFRVEYYKNASKALARIDMILGAYNQELQGVDYEKWKRPKLMITTDPRALIDIDNILTEIEGVTVDIEHLEVEDEAETK